MLLVASSDEVALGVNEGVSASLGEGEGVEVSLPPGSAVVGVTLTLLLAVGLLEVEGEAGKMALQQVFHVCTSPSHKPTEIDLGAGETFGVKEPGRMYWLMCMLYIGPGQGPRQVMDSRASSKGCQAIGGGKSLYGQTSQLPASIQSYLRW